MEIKHRIFFSHKLHIAAAICIHFKFFYMCTRNTNEGKVLSWIRIPQSLSLKIKIKDISSNEHELSQKYFVRIIIQSKHAFKRIKSVTLDLDICQ